MKQYICIFIPKKWTRNDDPILRGHNYKGSTFMITSLFSPHKSLLNNINFYLHQDTNHF